MIQFNIQMCIKKEVKMDYAVQLPPFIRSEHFGLHTEDSNEYVELYMHIAKLIEANHDWAVWHPEEVNKMDKDERSWKSTGWTPNGNARLDSRFNLCGDGLTIDVTRFRVRVIKRVVAKLRAADYKVSYTLGYAPGYGSNPRRVMQQTPSQIQDVELDDRPFSIFITLLIQRVLTRSISIYSSNVLLSC